MKNKHTKLEQHRIIFSLSNFGGTPKKFKVHGGGRDVFQNYKIRERTHLGNVARNKHTKFEQERSIIIFFLGGGVGCLSTRDDWAEAGNVVKNEYTKFEQDRSIEKKIIFEKIIGTKPGML